MGDYISISEAVVATGKSSSTIRRIVKRLADEGPPDTVKKESTSQGDKYFVKRDMLWKELGIQEDSTTESHVDTAETLADTNGRLVEVLYEQLQKKDEQLQKKDEQIALLLERQRETNILMNNYQQRLIGTAAAEREPEIAQQTPEQVTQKQSTSWIWLLVGIGILILIMLYSAQKNGFIHLPFFG